MTAGGDLAPDEKTPGLLAGGNVLFNNPWTFLAPGSTADRPVPSSEINGRLRFNTDDLVYEYYDVLVSMWVELSGSGTGTVNPGTANSIAFYAANGTAVSPTNSANNAVLITSGIGFPSLSTTLPTGLTIPSATITSSTAALTSGQVIAAPVNPTDIANKAYVDSSFGAGVTSITGTTNQVIASAATGAVTLSLPQDIATGSTPTFAGMTLTSIPLSVSSGGTGFNSVTTAPTATAWAGWDANKNLSANSFIEGYATTATAAGTTTLTVASAAQQYFTGATTQTVVLPVVSTLVLGQSFLVVNLSSGALTVQSSGANTISVVSAGTSARFTVISTSGTGASSWNSSYNEGELIIPVTVSQGGTGQTALTAYTLLAGGTTSTGALQQVAAGTSGQILTSAGSSSLPAWVTGTGTGIPVLQTSPTITTPIIDFVNSAAATHIHGFTSVASAVNYIISGNSISGHAPQIGSAGSDTDIGLLLFAKAEGTVGIVSNNTSTPFAIYNGTASGGMPQHRTNFLFSNTNTTNNLTFPDASGTILMTGQAINTVPSIAFSSTSGIIGTTTNDNAAAGSVGEFVTSVIGSGSPVSLSNGTAANITSISLTAGDWDVWGNVGFTGNVLTTFFAGRGWISTTSATSPDPSLFSQQVYPTGPTIFTVSLPAFDAPALRFSLASTTTIYLSVLASFATNTCSGFGGIYARRVR